MRAAGPLRVAMVSEHASPLAVLGGVDAGGQNMHVASLARALVARGHDVEVFTRRDDPGLADTVEVQPGLRVSHVPAGPAAVLGKDELAPFMPAFGAWLRERWTGDGCPDVVHAHFWMSGLAALAAAGPLRLPVVQTFHALGAVKARHQGSADTSPPERVAAERRIARAVDLVLATCADEVAELAALGAPTGRVRVVPCGVDTGLFRPHGPVAGRGGRFHLVTVGRLVERKGVDTVLAALAALVAEVDADLLVVGGPSPAGLGCDPEVRRLTALAARLGVADRVRFAGRLPAPQVAAHYRAADVVVATPWYEPFGLVPLEAMACGAAFVGSAVGGLLDTVRHGESGLLVPPRDPGALAAALRRLADDPGLRQRLGDAAWRRSLRYDTAHVAAETEAAYADVVAGRERGAGPGGGAADRTGGLPGAALPRDGLGGDLAADGPATLAVPGRPELAGRAGRRRRETA